MIAALAFALLVAFAAPAAAGTLFKSVDGALYDEVNSVVDEMSWGAEVQIEYAQQSTLDEWNALHVGQRLSVAQLLVTALVPRAGVAQRYGDRVILLKHCLDTAAKDKHLGHRRLADVSLFCAVDLGWR